jgi:hypothetical protein
MSVDLIGATALGGPQGYPPGWSRCAFSAGTTVQPRAGTSKHATVLTEVSRVEGVGEADGEAGDAPGDQVGDALVAFEHPAYP